MLLNQVIDIVQPAAGRMVEPIFLAAGWGTDIIKGKPQAKRPFTELWVRASGEYIHLGLAMLTGLSRIPLA